MSVDGTPIVLKSPCSHPCPANREGKLVRTPITPVIFQGEPRKALLLDMGTRFLVTVSFVCSSLIATGQITGRFYLEKTTFVKGEPVFLYFQVTNDGREVEDFYSKGGPYHCDSGYHQGLHRSTSSCSILSTK